MLPMKVSAMATSTGDWLSRAMVVGGALTPVDILLPPSRTDQYCNHKSKSPARFMAGSTASPTPDGGGTAEYFYVRIQRGPSPAPADHGWLGPPRRPGPDLSRRLSVHGLR